MAILLATSDRDQFRELSEMLHRSSFDDLLMIDPASIETGDLAEASLLVIDLDHAGVNEKFFGVVSRNFPNLPIIGFSSLTYHPELKKAMSNRIKACLSKPIDEVEFMYLVKWLIESEWTPTETGECK